MEKIPDQMLHTIMAGDGILGLLAFYAASKEYSDLPESAAAQESPAEGAEKQHRMEKIQK